MWNDKESPRKNGRYPTVLFNSETKIQFLEYETHFLNGVWYFNIDGGTWIPVLYFGKIIAWFDVPKYE